jgi:hypothetical protein
MRTVLRTGDESMSTITPVNALIGKAAAPTDKELASALGRDAKTLWDRLVREIGEETGADIQEWNSYSPKHGWSLRLKRAKRNIVYLIPLTGAFQVAFTLGKKAMQAARDAKLPVRILKIMESAPKYVEGTGVRLDVERAEEVEIIKKLAMIKVKN